MAGTCSPLHQAAGSGPSAPGLAVLGVTVESLVAAASVEAIVDAAARAVDSVAVGATARPCDASEPCDSLLVSDVQAAARNMAAISADLRHPRKRDLYALSPQLLRPVTFSPRSTASGPFAHCDNSRVVTCGSDEIRFLTGNAVVGGRSTYVQDAWAVVHGDGGVTWAPTTNPAAANIHHPSRVDIAWPKRPA